MINFSTSFSYLYISLNMPLSCRHWNLDMRMPLLTASIPVNSAQWETGGKVYSLLSESKSIPLDDFSLLEVLTFSFCLMFIR